MTSDAELQPYLTALARGTDPAVALADAAAGHDPRPVLRRLASLQGGQVATRQARVVGLSRNALHWLVSSAEVEVVRRGVARFRSASGAPDPSVTAWLLCWPDAVISRASAAAHHGLRSVAAPQWPTITLPFGVRSVAGEVTVHRTRSMPAADRVLVGGVVYTTLARTVCDLADPGDPWLTLTILDDAVAQGARPRWIHSTACRSLNGRSGVRLITQATAPGAAAEFRSWLERAAGHVYRQAHLPDPEWNVGVHDSRGRIGVVDALWRPWRVVSEKEGLRFHTPPAQRRRDAERFNRLLDAQFVPRRFTWEDVVRRPVYVAATLGRALAAAGADIDLAAIPRHIDPPGLPFAP